MNKKEKEQLSDTTSEFAFEKRSSPGRKEIIEEIDDNENIDDIFEEPPKATTIKIISERDIQYLESPPPNFSSKFKCILHFKGGDYRKRKALEVAPKEAQ